MQVFLFKNEEADKAEKIVRIGTCACACIYDCKYGKLYTTY